MEKNYDFSNETLTITKYIKYEIDKYESLILNFPETITGMETSNLTYSVKLKFNKQWKQQLSIWCLHS